MNKLILIYTQNLVLSVSYQSLQQFMVSLGTKQNVKSQCLFLNFVSLDLN